VCELPNYIAGEEAAARWIKRASRRARLDLMAEIARSYVHDETTEESRRRAETLLWIATASAEGHWHARSTPEDFLQRD